MVETLGIVEVGSLLGQPPSVARKLGGKSLLEWVARRATDCQRLTQVVVLAPDSSEHRALAELVPSDVPLLNSAAADSLARLTAAATQYGAQAIVRIPATSPFVDPVLIDRLVSSADERPGCDYIGYCHGDGRPAIQNRLGVGAEWCSTAALTRADERARGAVRTAGLRYIVAHPESFALRLVPVPAALDRQDVRLAVHGHEDWEHAVAIYDALGPDACDWRHIAGLLDRQPDMRARMAVLNRQE